jgi:hypothetical protein
VEALFGSINVEKAEVMEPGDGAAGDFQRI